MYDINWIKANRESFDRGLTRRGLAPLSEALLAIDSRRREAIVALNEMQEKRNRLSKEIGQAKAQKDEARAQSLLAEVGSLKETAPAAEAEVKRIEAELTGQLEAIPNLPLDDVPDGSDEHANVEYFGRNTTAEQAARVRPPKPSLSFAPKEHFELGEAMGMMDFEIAAKLSGSRFVVLKNQLARMERALGQFMLDLHTNEHGYVEVAPPILVRDEALYGTGQLPKFADDLFKTQRSRRFDAYPEEIQTEFAFRMPWADLPTPVGQRNAELAALSTADFLETATNANALYLIPTAEVPLTNFVNGAILSEDELPLRFTALTPCFRSEAGSAGRDTRGMLRQHQFNKVEMVSITSPDSSIDEHERMLSCAEAVLQKLGLHYRVMALSTGDMGFGAQKTYDLEVWLPGQNTYREISSVSVCGDFQARRMEARVKGKDGKIRPVHTLNGSGVAVGRALIAVMENYQQEDGSIVVPEALRPYMGGLARIGAGN